MRMIQGQFPRLKDDMQQEEFGERKVVLPLMVSLHGHQATRKVRINQVLNTLMIEAEGFHSCAASEDANNCFV